MFNTTVAWITLRAVDGLENRLTQHGEEENRRKHIATSSGDINERNR